MTPRLVTLLTDFGLQDPFVGQMHGVLLSRCPDLRIVDLAHGVTPQNVTEAGFLLERSFSWFPQGSVHVAVVDPGVGTERSVLVAEALGHVFVAPDNGLLSRMLKRADWPEVRAVNLGALGLKPASNTFHGRDIFAPVAAEIASGRLLPSAVGPEIVAQTLATTVTLANRGVHGQVVTVDRFGNLITDIDSELLAPLVEPRVHVLDHELELVRTYADVPPGALLALVSSCDTVEVACREGSATDRLGIGRGAEVRVESHAAAGDPTA